MAELKSGDIVPELNEGTAVVYAERNGLTIHDDGLRLKCGNIFVIPVCNAAGSVEPKAFLIIRHRPFEVMEVEPPERYKNG